MSDDAPDTLKFTLAHAIDTARRKPFTAFTEPCVTIENEDQQCSHTKGGNLLVDCKTRRVTCTQCHTLIDPFDALVLCVNAERFSAMRAQDVLIARADMSDCYEIQNRFQSEAWANRYKYRQRTAVRKRAECKHTLKEQAKSGKWYCPSCRQILDSLTPDLPMPAPAGEPAKEGQ